VNVSRPALILLVALSACSRSRGSDFTVRRPPVAAAPVATTVALRALHFGDFGDSTPQQDAVARAIIERNRHAPFDLGLVAGDNIYQCGPNPALPGAGECAFGPDGSSVMPGYSPPTDPLFARAHERALASLLRGASPVPLYLVLGNHDVQTGGRCGPASASRLKACLEVAHRSAHWIMPARHYVLDQGPARFIALDSNLLKGDYGGFTLDGEAAFVAEAAKGCGERLCFVVAHHNPATAGIHRSDFTADYRSRLERLEQAAGGRIAAWLGGHDHDLQHLRSPAGYDVFVSGNGARARPDERFAEAAPPGAQLLFASTSWGYGVLEVSPQAWSYRFENDRGQPIDCCAATRGGRCEPVACAP
jgi:tartrate-resistant acid phosphatase type 5